MAEEIHEFSPDDLACVLNDPRPPRYWYNYLWSEEGYCAQVSQIGHGGSCYLNERAEMCAVNADGARYVYLRDDETGSCWNAGEGPLLEPVADYRCVHHLAFTKLWSSKGDLRSSWRIFVPRRGYHEIWTITVANRGARQRHLSLFSLASFSLEGFPYPRYYEMYRCCETFFDPELNGVYCQSRHPYAPHKRYNAFLASSRRVDHYDGDLAHFLGPLGSYPRPETPLRNDDCSDTGTVLFVLGGVLQHKLVLEPGEETALHVFLGLSESRPEARETVKSYGSPGKVEETLARTIESTVEAYASLSARTPEARLDRLMNHWLQKQVDFCLVGKKGVRDNLQIAVGLLNCLPARAEEEILEVLRHQFADGHAVLTWQPYDDTHYSDQPFWIVWAVIELLKETGRLELLERVVPYQDGGSGTVLDHMKAAVCRLAEDRGPHGLVKIWHADWNDALNVTTDPEAESVMLSEQYCYALWELAALAERIGDGDYAGQLRAEYGRMKALIDGVAWDGAWYLRALSQDGPIGGRDSAGSKIYLNAQTWAVLAGIPEGERLPAVLKAIDGMEHDYGFPINEPAYDAYLPQVGRMSAMLPGLYENGGVYCHASAFKIVMDCRCGRPEQALRTLLKIMPDSDANPSVRSGAEPYVFTNCYALHPKYYGKSYQSWTTGTSAWVLMALYEGILGLRRDYDGLRLAPCFPPQWERAEATRSFRGTKYHLVYENAGGKSGATVGVEVDGVRLAGDLLPLFADGKVHEVVVRIG